MRAFEAPLDSAGWSLEKGANGCRLTHRVPRYGLAEFYSGGAAPNFQLRLARASAEGTGWATLRSVAPLYQPGVASRELGQVAVLGGATPFRLATPLALKVLNELEQGMNPTFFLNPGRREEVTVALSSVNFPDAYQKFQGCLSAVVAERQQAAAKLAAEAAKPLDSVYDESSPNRATLFFATDSHELTPSARAVLDQIAGYIKTQKEVELVVIDGHADERSTPKYNLALSGRRAEAVKAYLQGASELAAGKIRTRSYGEQFPAVANDGPVGLARNRRVLLMVQGLTAPAAQIEKTVESTPVIEQATKPELLQPKGN